MNTRETQLEIKRGVWDDCWIKLKDGRELFAAKVNLTEGGRADIRDRDGLCLAIVGINDIVSARH